MSTSETKTNTVESSSAASCSSATSRLDPPELSPSAVWRALAGTPGVGVCIMDVEGRLLFINETATVLFIDKSIENYQGRMISEFQPKPYVEERLGMIARVLSESRPMRIRHIFLGRRIESTVWPVYDKTPPCNRVIVVTRQACGGEDAGISTPQCETIATNFIDLGPLDVLTSRELEVFTLLGHGMSVPRIANLLHRSPKTIERHKCAIAKKLNVKSQAEMVAVVSSVGLEISDAKLERMRDTLGRKA